MRQIVKVDRWLKAPHFLNASGSISVRVSLSSANFSPNPLSLVRLHPDTGHYLRMSIHVFVMQHSLAQELAHRTEVTKHSGRSIALISLVIKKECFGRTGSDRASRATEWPWSRAGKRHHEMLGSGYVSSFCSSHDSLASAGGIAI